MSPRFEAVKASESGATTFGVINTDTLEFLMALNRRSRSNRKILTMGVVIPRGGLADTLNTRRFLSLKLLTVSKSRGAVLTSSGREGRESLLLVDTDGTEGSCWGRYCQFSIK